MIQRCLLLEMLKNVKHLVESILYYTRGITSKRVSSVGVHLGDLPPGQHSSEET